MKKEIEILVRAVIEIKGKILVCRKIGNDYYFFPGGHLEFAESAKEGLIREIKEELGATIKECHFMGASEHIFTENNEKHQEINLTFYVPAQEINRKSKEDHLQFFLLSKEQLSKEKVLPKILVKAVLKWLEDKKPFWTSQI